MATSSPRYRYKYQNCVSSLFRFLSPLPQPTTSPTLDQTEINLRALPFSSRVKHGAKHILTRDTARAKKLIAGLHPHGPLGFRRGQEELSIDSLSGSSIDVTDAGVTYTLPVGVGNPATEYTLLIDTGSSNTWVGADKAYEHTSTSKSTNNSVTVSYGSGSFSGTEFTDQVSLGPGLVIKGQSIGVASTATGFQGVDGILGIGPVDLTQGTVKNTTEVPTVTDNLSSQGLIPTNSIGISYVPSTSTAEVANGELTFGGVDSSKIIGDVEYVPITKTSPANKYWGIDQTLTYGDSTTLLNSAGIVDTGTTLLLIATDAFNAYQKATGATLDQTTGLLTVTEEQFNNLQSLFFKIGNVTYELTANAQIWPRALNSVLGGDPDGIYLVTADLGSPSGQGLDFINGFAFLQRFYSVFDTTNSQVGLATTPFTQATTN